MNTAAIKCIDQHGRSIAVMGEILNQKGAVVSTFEVPIGDVTVTAQRDFGSGYVTVAQGLTDDSGLTSMPLDPTCTFVWQLSMFPKESTVGSRISKWDCNVTSPVILSNSIG